MTPEEETQRSVPAWFEVLVGFIILAGLTAIGAVFLSSVSSSADSQPGPQNGNTVQLSNDVSKWCDGTNLVYQSWGNSYGGSALSVIPNSSECTQ